MQLFTLVYLLLKCPAIEGFWASGMEGISLIRQEEARGIFLLSCGKKQYIGKRLFLTLLKVAFIT